MCWIQKTHTRKPLSPLTLLFFLLNWFLTLLRNSLNLSNTSFLFYFFYQIKVITFLFLQWVRFPSSSEISMWINSNHPVFYLTLPWDLFVILALLWISHFLRSLFNIRINRREHQLACHKLIEETMQIELVVALLFLIYNLNISSQA